MEAHMTRKQKSIDNGLDKIFNFMKRAVPEIKTPTEIAEFEAAALAQAMKELEEEKENASN